jgi:hypothetical protein
MARRFRVLVIDDRLCVERPRQSRGGLSQLVDSLLKLGPKGADEEQTCRTDRVLVEVWGAAWLPTSGGALALGASHFLPSLRELDPHLGPLASDEAAYGAARDVLRKLLIGQKITEQLMDEQSRVLLSKGEVLDSQTLTRVPELFWRDLTVPAAEKERVGTLIDQLRRFEGPRLLSDPAIAGPNLTVSDFDVIVCDSNFEDPSSATHFTAAPDTRAPPVNLLGLDRDVVARLWPTLAARHQGYMWAIHAVSSGQVSADKFIAILTAHDGSDREADEVFAPVLSPVTLANGERPKEWPLLLKYGKDRLERMKLAVGPSAAPRSSIPELLGAIRVWFSAWLDRHVLDPLTISKVMFAARDPLKPVMVLGETGTGKERIAKYIAELQGVDHFTFNCASVTEALAGPTLFGNVEGAWTDSKAAMTGWFLDAAVQKRIRLPMHSGTAANNTPHRAWIRGVETNIPNTWTLEGGVEGPWSLRPADGVRPGVLFLDEIGHLPAAIQAQILRTLEAPYAIQPVGLGASVDNVRPRIVAATSDPRVAEYFGEKLHGPRRIGDDRVHLLDLFKRLGGLVIRVPPFDPENAEERVSGYLSRRAHANWSKEARAALVERVKLAVSDKSTLQFFGHWREVRQLVENVEALMLHAPASGLRFGPNDQITPELVTQMASRWFVGTLREQPTDKHDRRALSGSFLIDIDEERRRFLTHLREIDPDCRLDDNYGGVDLKAWMLGITDLSTQASVRDAFKSTIGRYLDCAVKTKKFFLDIALYCPTLPQKVFGPPDPQQSMPPDGVVDEGVPWFWPAIEKYCPGRKKGRTARTRARP